MTKNKGTVIDQGLDKTTYSKEQLVKCKTLGLPVDAVFAILQDNQAYTKEQASSLVTKFLERMV